MATTKVIKINPWLWFGSSALAISVYFSSVLSPLLEPKVLGINQTSPQPVINNSCDQTILCQNELEVLTQNFPTYADAYVQKAYFYWLNHDLELASKNLQIAKSLDPLNPFFETLEKFFN